MKFFTIERASILRRGHLDDAMFYVVDFVSHGTIKNVQVDMNLIGINRTFSDIKDVIEEGCYDEFFD